MFPWLWLWMPQVHFPWSGSVAQSISPTTDWFFGTIPPEAGTANVEKEVFYTASYGKQIGLMQEVLLSLAQSPVISKDKAAQSLKELEKVNQQIETAKTEAYNKKRIDIAKQLEELRMSDAEGFKELMSKFQK